jgi:phage/plasmid-associated DNA primase
MAITQALPNSFKKQLLDGDQDFSTSGGGGDKFKLALYVSTATLGAATTSFTTSGQVANSGTYVSGGKALVNSGTSVVSTVAFTDFADLSFTGVTITARGALIYNTSFSNAAVAVLNFVTDKKFVADNNIVDIINDLKQKKTSPKTVFKPISPPSSPSPTSVTQVYQNEDDKYLDLLNNVIKNEVVRGVKQISWDYWFQICGILKHNSYKKSDWLNYSSKCFPNTTEASALWDGIKNQANMNIHGLQNIAKYINPDGYKEWLKKWCIYGISFNEVNEPYACANKIYKTLGQTLKLCNEKWYMLTNNNLWKKQNEPTKYIISEIHKYLDFEKDKLNSMSSNADGEEKKSLITKLEEWIKLYYVVTKSGYLSVLTKILRPLLADDDFDKKLDNNKGKLCFRNGVMDLETKTFRNGIMWDDYITDTIPYDYVPSNYDFVKPVLLKILNNNEEHLNYYLSIIGYSFIGDANLEKSLYFMIDKTEDGKGDNGKTFFFDILNDLLPNYVYKSKSTFILKKNTKSHKQLSEMKGKRLVWLEELPKDETNAELMKEIADGKTTENEVMFGTSEIINIMFKMFVLSNNIPNITADEEAVYNRFKQISFNSHFDRSGERTVDNPEKLEFVADVKLSNTIKEKYYNEVFNLIIDYAHKYYKNGLPKIPQQFIKDTTETKKNNDKFGKWFSDNCEKDEDSKIALKLLASLSGVKEDKVKESMKKMGYKYDCDMKGIKDINDKATRGGYAGIKIIDCDEEDD